MRAGVVVVVEGWVGGGARGKGRGGPDALGVSRVLVGYSVGELRRPSVLLGDGNLKPRGEGRGHSRFMRWRQDVVELVVVVAVEPCDVFANRGLPSDAGARSKMRYECDCGCM